ncbi:MAG: GNAT family N-acetyltransferase [Phormidesmis sp.]
MTFSHALETSAAPETICWTPLSMGFPAFSRLMGHDSYCEHEIATRAPSGFAYLWVLGVHPMARGKGLAKQMVLSALSQMKRDGHSSCWLRTDNPQNLLFYQNLGFDQVHAGTVPESGLSYWLFAKDLG